MYVSILFVGHTSRHAYPNSHIWTHYCYLMDLIGHKTSSLPAFIILPKLGSGALLLKCSPCMVPDWHYWHTRSGCQRRPDLSSFVANSWRLQQCQPRPLSDCPQRLHRCRCFPNLRLSEVKFLLWSHAAYQRRDLADQQRCLHHWEDWLGCRLRDPPAPLGISVDFMWEDISYQVAAEQCRGSCGWIPHGVWPCWPLLFSWCLHVFKRLKTSCYLFGSFIFPLFWTPSIMEKMLAGIT